MAFFGVVGGAVIGIVASRIVGAGADPGFLKALGSAQLVAVVLIGGIGGAARLMADVPPLLDGKTLVLAIELEWPEGRSPSQEPEGAEWYLRLHAMSGSVARASSDGPLWREDARLEDGRWIVPGAVDVFTSRGRRVITFEPDSLVREGFEVPLPGRPGRDQLEWSRWLPTERTGAAASEARFRFRYKVVPAGQPVRTEQFGPFEILSISNGFGMYTWDGGPMRWTANTRFLVRLSGKPVVIEHRDADSTGRFDLMDAVATVAGLQPALLVQVDAPQGEGPCYLVVAESSGARVERVALCGDGVRASPLTADPARYTAALSQPRLRGRLDRAGYATPGPYLFRDAVLDTRQLAVRHFSPDELRDAIERIPPLGVSPDGLSFVRLAWAGDAGTVGLLVMDLATNHASAIPLDRAHMRYAELEQIDPAWLLHYFEWKPDAAGQDRLVARADVVPLPHKGVLTLDNSGYREYRLTPALPALRAAVIEFIVAEFGGEPQPADESDFSHQVRVGDAVVHVSYSTDERHVGVWMDRGGDTALVTTIAERFDAALRSGKYDHLFGQ